MRRGLSGSKTQSTSRRWFDAYNRNFSSLEQVDAPSHLFLFPDPRLTLGFIRRIRQKGDQVKSQPNPSLFINLGPVLEIDYASIQMLKAVVFYLRTRHSIRLGGNLPKEEKPKSYIRACGYLEGLVDFRGKPFPPSEQSAYILFEDGHGRLTDEENLNISDLLADAIEFLGGDIRHEMKLKTLLLECCSNSIEWSLTGEVGCGQWMLGMKKETLSDGQKEVIFTVTDAGRGILTSLRRKFTDTVLGLVQIQTEHQVLQLTFERRWGSNTQEPNRNNGLPTIKKAADIGIIKDLRVVTNNVILHYGDIVAGQTFPAGFPRYAGTFFQWKVTQDCLPIMEKVVNYEDD